MTDRAPRLRFAPSPTGYLHVGGARTALFNWLYARRHGGVFVLRIEDTDAERSSQEMVSAILEGLQWLGLDWDEGPGVGGGFGPYFQSERLDRHRQLADRLVAGGAAYYCYCSQERLQRAREASEARGSGWMYDRRCLSLDPKEIAELEATGAPRAVRFRVPPGSTVFDDLVRGRLTFDHGHLEDFVILRSDGLPTYHLSVVADDVEMRISHVIRGDDHVSNTPKQILIYRSIDAPLPQFGHVPLILGPDKKRLSKRHGATAVGEYRRGGVLPEAMVNFLALLGWSPGTGQEIFTRSQLVEQFSLEGIGGGSAVFNPAKLEWMNGEHIARLAPDDLVSRIQPALEAARLWSATLAGERREWLHQILALVRPRVKRLDDFAVQLRPFLSETVEYDPAAAEKHLGAPELACHIEALSAALAELDCFDASTVEGALRRTAEAQGVKAGTLIHATRVAVTGQAVSPGLFEVLALLGRDRTLARLSALRDHLRSR